MMDGIRRRLEERNITLELTDSAKIYIANAGFDPDYGARPLKRALFEIVEDTLAELILEGKLKENDRVRFDEVSGEIRAEVLS